MPNQDLVAHSDEPTPNVSVKDSELVFVGYGVDAPEYGWNDYKDVDVRGKTVVMLIGDPPVPDPRDTTKLDPNVFRGPAMTYYGRWTYKFDVAAERGAAAVLLVRRNPESCGLAIDGDDARATMVTASRDGELTGYTWREAVRFRVFWLFAGGAALYGLVASGIGAEPASRRAAAMSSAVRRAVPKGASALSGWCSSTTSTDS